MPRHHGAVLVDTNVIIECHRSGSWRALVGGYAVETTEDCVKETQAGSQWRRPEQRIGETALRESLSAVHDVHVRARAALVDRVSDIALDRGEESLWAHAVRRDDDWLLCGPDIASLRCGIRLGFRERLMPLERLLGDVGHRAGSTLREAYTRAWHDRTIGRLILDETIG